MLIVQLSGRIERVAGSPGCGVQEGSLTTPSKVPMRGIHDRGFAVRRGNRTGDEIGFPNEIRDDPRLRTPINFLGPADLCDLPALENGHPVGNGEGLLLVMCHVDRGKARLFADAPNFSAHFEAQLGIEIRKRFIKQKGTGTDDERARQGDALLLTAGKLSNLAVGVVLHPDGGKSLFDAPV